MNIWDAALFMIVHALSLQDPEPKRTKPKHSYTDLLLREHKKMLAEQTGGIDYRKVVEKRP